MARAKARPLYTRTGDKTTTVLLGGVRISKRSWRIEAIGSLDEMNSFLGFLLALGEQQYQGRERRKILTAFKKIIGRIQNDCFVIGADLSMPLIRSRSVPHPLHRHLPMHLQEKARTIPKITHNEVHRLEEWIDHFQNNLPPLRNFILPRGNSVGAFLQITRAICRRTERSAVALATHSRVNPLVLAYLNRLSDLLFVLSRAVNYRSGKPEILWKSPIKP